MRITIGNNTRKAMVIIGIENYPFTPEELSGKFRALVKKYHPDINKSEEAKKDTQEIINSYKLLKNLAISSITEEEKLKAQEMFNEDEDMFSLWEACSDCEGMGYKLEKEFVRPCFIRKVKCNQCSDGIFTLKSGRKIECRKCKGTGIFKIKCKRCNGTGFLGEDNIVKVNCFKCKGIGKVKLNPFNPVIPKGAVL